MLEMICGSCEKRTPAMSWLQNLLGQDHPKGFRRCPKCKIVIKITLQPASVFVDHQGCERLYPGKILITPGVDMPDNDILPALR